MKPTSLITLVLATLMGVGTACWLSAHEGRRRWPKPTPPPPPSPIYIPSTERVPTAAEIELEALRHTETIALEIEHALASNDRQRREAAFTFLLPELIQVEPKRVVEMLARQEPGEARDTLRGEIARQWIARDPEAAIAWMKSLDEPERRTSAATAVKSIVAHSPAEASILARAMGLGDAVTGARN